MSFREIADLLAHPDRFSGRHIAVSPADLDEMLERVGHRTLDDLADTAVPEAIRLNRPLALPPAATEHEALRELRAIADQNRVCRSLIGMGYYDTITPPVIQRNILENPGWYTQYTPYQAEISQGRLEALLNFQTMVADLTGLPMANASLLDEATAAAEAMHMARAIREDDVEQNTFFVADDCHPQTIAVVQTRAKPLGVRVLVGPMATLDPAAERVFGALLSYPSTTGHIHNLEPVVQRLRDARAVTVVATDLLALTLLKPPGEFGADIAVGSSQRFGVPLGFGGPHAAFMACREEFKRHIPGRLIGVSKDAHGNPALRLAIQTREQHIRREKATSNICTAQVLLAVMASMYAVYHGPSGLRRIAQRIHAHASLLAAALRRDGHHVADGPFFDTLHVRLGGWRGSADTASLRARAEQAGINFRYFHNGSVGISLDELSNVHEIEQIVGIFAAAAPEPLPIESLVSGRAFEIPAEVARQTGYLTHDVFNSHHSEHELLRYIKKLESRDLSLTTSMIPLGSCTMKLNAAAEMFPVSWPAFSKMHPFAPADQARGYAIMCEQLSAWLAEITGFSAVSLQPNAGSQGEYAGLLAIRAFHESRGHGERDVCLIPTSAHGTNPASAIVAGFKVVAVQCDALGNVDLADLRQKAAVNADRLGALMITYPSTHGVFEGHVRELCEVVHQHGGQVYMDGANMNAQVGLCRPGDIGADVCHLNLHKTFCIPHGGGGPGMGPICVARHLAPFLPGSIAVPDAPVGPVSAAPLGSPSILPISWMYIRMMGPDGLLRATQVAIASANYMARRLQDHYPIVYRGNAGLVAHEFILDCRSFEQSAGIRVEDIAKRLMDYGFHAPTMSWPVAGTLMIEPTESEPKAELDRLCDALISIREEIRSIEQGKLSKTDNPLKHAPHTASVISADNWTHAYSREQAAFPAAWLRQHKFWPAVGRVDNVWGDRNLFCTCAGMEELAAAR